MAPLPVNTSKLISPRKQEQTVSFKFDQGINRAVGVKQLSTGELEEALNVRYTDDGRMVTRNGLTKLTTVGTDGGAAITGMALAFAKVSGVFFDSAYFDSVTFGNAEGLQYDPIFVDENYKLYKIINGTALSEIGQALGPVTICPFAGKTIIMDGSYMKYWNGQTLAIAYDYGSGTTAYQFDNTGLDDEATFDFTGTGNIGYGCTFTTQVWDTGYTIPILNVQVVLSKTGSPTGTLTAKLYNSAIDTVLATSTTYDVSQLTGDAAEIDITFDSTNTYSMAQNTDYFISIEYSGGDGSNYVSIHLETVTSGGIGYYYSDPNWVSVATQNPLIAVQPGRPPKAEFGAPWKERLWFIDPNYPGWVRFTNVGTVFDHSTANGAGYIGTSDSGYSYPIGAIIPHYSDLYVFGTKESPFLSKITGDTPDDFAQTVLLQGVSANYKSVSSTINDIWFANESGVYAISGVQEYGDIRNYSPGSPINNTVMQYLNGNAFSAFNPIDGQFWLKLEGYDRVLIGHTRSSGKKNKWTEYLFEGITPTSFGCFQGVFYIGGDDGHLYSLSSELLDGSTQPTYTIKSCITEIPFRSAQVREYYASIEGEENDTLDMKIYRNGESSALLTKEITVTDDLISNRLNFKARSIQVELSNFDISEQLSIGEMHLKALPLEVK